MNFGTVQSDILKFNHPFTMIVSGPTRVGKTVWVSNLLKYSEKIIKDPPTKFFWFYCDWQPIYSELAQYIPNIEFIQGTEKLGVLKENHEENKIVVIDDLMREATKYPALENLFTKGSHHWNLSCIFIVQNLYFKGIRSARLNTHYVVLFRSPDKQQITCFAKQLYPRKSKILFDAYEDVTKDKYSPLVIDMTSDCPDKFRLRAHVFPDERMVIYRPKV